MSRKNIICVINTLLVAMFPVLFMYFQNVEEILLNEIVVPLLLFAGLGISLFFVVLLMTKTSEKAELVAVLFLLCLLNYSALENAIFKLFPSLRYWHVLPIILILLFYISRNVVIRKMPQELSEVIAAVIGCTFLLLIAINAVLAIPDIYEKVIVQKTVNDRISISEDKLSSKPNIYYILFDEYATVPFVEKYYNYDNSKLTETLENLHFNVSYTGHNESTLTATVATNYVNLDYVVNDNTSISEREQLRWNNTLFQMLSAKGYEIVSTGYNSSFYGLPNVLDTTNAVTKEATTIGGETVTDLLLQKTFLYPALMKRTDVPEAASDILEALQYLKDDKNFPDEGQFTIAHILLPHQPFYFKADGKVRKVISSNWIDDKYYLEQYIFATSQLLEIAKSITENDPGSIVLLLSDHGARGIKASTSDARTFLNAIYYQGEQLDIEGLSGVNTLRVVFGKLFDVDLELVELPHNAN